jgi:NodT family efflux transporter outer membrane factor (OMF) lipoprotein
MRWVATLLVALLPAGALAAEAAGPPHGFWRAFGDPQLDALVTRTLQANGDARAARARVEQAEAIARQNLAPLLPQVGASISANAAPGSSLGFQPGLPPGTPGVPTADVVWTGSALGTLAIEPDLSGRRYLAWRASRFDAEASHGDRLALELSLAARVTELYFDLAVAQERLALLEEQERLNRTTLELLELRFDTGSATALDVLQQRQQVSATEVQVPPARARIRTLRQLLAVLSGQPPSAPIEARSGLPTPPPLPPELPAEWVDERPDVRAARARTFAAKDRHGSGIRALFPSLRLSGQAGWSLRRVEDTATQSTWGAGATLSIPLYQGGAEYAGIRQLAAADRAAVAQYEQLLLNAAAEIASAAVRDEEQRAQLAAQERQVEAARLLLQESRERYLAGLTTYLPVLTALATYQAAQIQLLQTRRDLLGLRVQLFTAAGGAWELSQPAGGQESTR